MTRFQTGCGSLLLLLALPALTRADVSFQESTCRFSGTGHDRVLADFNGDRRTDILVEYTRTDREKSAFAVICYQKADGSFGPNSDVDYTFPPEVRVFDTGDVAEAPGDELVVVTGKGVYWVEKTKTGLGPLIPLIESANLFTGSEPDKVRLHHFLWDLDRDGKLEVVLPADQGPLIFHRNPQGKYTLSQELNLPPEISYRVGSFGDIMITDDINQFLRFRTYERRIIASHTMPDLFFEDVNGDGRTDILALLKNKLRIFLQNAEGAFPKSPNLTQEISILSAAEKKLSLTGEAMTFADLDHDGLLDIIMTKWGSTENRTEMTRYLYFGRPGPKWPKQPDQIIGSASAGVEFGAYDLNGDKKLDLVIPYFHFAPAQAFKIMTENSIKIQFQLYLCGPNGRYSQEPGKNFAKPDRRLILNYKVDIIGILLDFQTLIQGKFMPLITFRDFNGDGYPDLVADTGADKLAFYWGNKNVEYSKQPDQVIPIESALSYDLADLNGDGRTDIITYYESEERTKEKRKMAQKARQEAQQAGGEAPSGLDESQLLVTTAEATRIKVLMSKIK
jgi:hypothetical protein